MEEVTIEEIENFVKWLNRTYSPMEYKLEKLKVRYRISKIYMGDELSRSAWGFVDFQGNVYKADTWNRPAKHIRGHVTLRDTYKFGRYSPHYLN